MLVMNRKTFAHWTSCISWKYIQERIIRNNLLKLLFHSVDPLSIVSNIDYWGEYKFLPFLTRNKTIWNDSNLSSFWIPGHPESPITGPGEILARKFFVKKPVQLSFGYPSRSTLWAKGCRVWEVFGFKKSKPQPSTFTWPLFNGSSLYTLYDLHNA